MRQHWIYKKEACTVWLCLIFLCNLFLNGNVVEATTQNLPPGVVIADENGISATAEGEYYIDLPNILPGDSYKKDITIRSLDIKEPFDLGVLVTPKSKDGMLDLNDVVTLTLTLDGKKIYNGKLLGDGTFDWTTQPLRLGVCEYGKDQLLTAEFSIDKNLDTESFKEESQLLYYWTFVATKNQDKPKESTAESTGGATAPKRKGMLPMTGEEIKNWIYKILTGLLLVLILVLLWKKKREKKTEEGE